MFPHFFSGLGKPHLAHFKAKLCCLLAYKHLPEGVQTARTYVGSAIPRNIGMQMYKNPAGDKVGFLGWHGGSDNDRDGTSHLLDGNFFD